MPFDQEIHRKLRVDWDEKSERLTEASNLKTRTKDLLDSAKIINKTFGSEETKKVLLMVTKHHKTSIKIHMVAYDECVVAKKLFADSCELKREDSWEKIKRTNKVDPVMHVRLIETAPDLLEVLQDMLSNFHDQERNDKVIKIVAKAKLIIARVNGESA